MWMWMRTDVVALAAWAASRQGMLGWDRHNDEFGAVKTAGFLPLGRCPLRKHCSQGKQEDNDKERQWWRMAESEWARQAGAERG